MATLIRPEMSKKNKYYVEKHRYYELKHFCLQYPIWKKAYAALDGLSNRPNDLEIISKTNRISDPTERCAAARMKYSRFIEMVEQTAIKTDSELYSYILIGVTEGRTYEYLKSILNIPCCRQVYYEMYRKFFYLLNRVRE